MSSFALISQYENLDYSTYAENIIRISRKLEEMNISKGDKVAIFANNQSKYAMLLFALFNIGAIAVPINLQLPLSQINEMLKSINCNIFFANTFEKQREFLDCKYYTFNDFFSDIQINKSSSSEFNFREIFEAIDKDNEATIIFTSGSSGKPNAVLHTIGNHYYNALGSNENIPFGSDDRWLLSLPLYHVGGLSILFRAAISGGAIAFSSIMLHTIKAIKTLAPTHISLVPTQLFRLLDKRGGIAALKKLKAVLIGGSSISEELLERAYSKKIKLFTTYGSTEMASQITTTQEKDKLKKLLSSGRVLPFREIKINTDNEILVKGKTLFKGYIKDDKLISPLDSDGWFYTGDLGEFDTDGYLNVIGRKDKMFISGGENIHPEEIENALLQIDEIEQVAIVPIDSKEFGKRIVAFIKFKDDSELFFEEINDTLIKQIASYKIPDYYFPFPDDYKQKGIKIDREYFRKLAEKTMNKLNLFG